MGDHAGYPSSAMVLTEGMAGLLGMTPLAITSSARPAHSLILACPQARVVRTRSISEVRAWTENPEQLYSAAERRGLVERGMLKLPAKYRVVLVLRDLEQLSTEETASALGLGIPAIKSRLCRARLMLREALAPHFAARAERIGL
jgi:RNA polymerase sigma factor (sigma-70 family)